MPFGMIFFLRVCVVTFEPIFFFFFQTIAIIYFDCSIFAELPRIVPKVYTEFLCFRSIIGGVQS